MKFTMLFKTNLIGNDILDVIRNVLGNGISIVEDDLYYVIYHNEDDENLNILFKNITEELLVNIRVYNSYDLDSVKLSKELNIAGYLLPYLPSGCYNLKTALLKSNKIENKSYILDFILEGSGVSLDLIKAMALADLNVSKASKISYIHRNTLLYKLDKLALDKGFDLRNFIDEYILFNLVENRTE